jgi:hypothetical protein
LPRQVIVAYSVLVIRIWLAYILCDYGWGKLTDGQFGLEPAELQAKVNEVSLFRLSWYLFDHEPFKSFIGCSQIGIGLLLVSNRTVIIGTLLSIPVWLNILFIDLTFMGEAMAPAFVFRISYYLLLTMVVLFYHRGRLLLATRALTERPTTNYKFPIWAYVLVPVFGFCIEFIPIVPHLIKSLVD